MCKSLKGMRTLRHKNKLPGYLKNNHKQRMFPLFTVTTEARQKKHGNENLQRAS